MSGPSASGTDRAPPLNLTDTEVSIAYTLIQRGEPPAFVQEEGIGDDYESLLSKVKDAKRSVDAGTEQ